MRLTVLELDIVVDIAVELASVEVGKRMGLIEFAALGLSVEHLKRDQYVVVVEHCSSELVVGMQMERIELVALGLVELGHWRKSQFEVEAAVVEAETMRVLRKYHPIAVAERLLAFVQLVALTFWRVMIRYI